MNDSSFEKIIGLDVYFGEILGKHSEVSGTLAREDFAVVTEDQEFIQKWLDLEINAGYNPLHYICSCPKIDCFYHQEDDAGDFNCSFEYPGDDDCRNSVFEQHYIRKN